MTAEVSNASIQAMMPKLKKEKDRLIMKITRDLVDLLIDPDPTYKHAVMSENRKQLLYTVLLRAIHEMLESAMLWCKKFRSDLESIGFILIQTIMDILQTG